jgi:hypothetical protein
MIYKEESYLILHVEKESEVARRRNGSSSMEGTVNPAAAEVLKRQWGHLAAYSQSGRSRGMPNPGTW